MQRKFFSIIIALVLVLSFSLVTAVPVRAGGIPAIDGVISSGEWDDHYLGTSVTTWSGGMSVDVYGFADDTYLYAAYVADTSQPGWSVATGLCVDCNFYYSTVKDVNLLDTIFQMWAPGKSEQVMQTHDWLTWEGKGTLEDVGVEYAYKSMWDPPDGQGVAELKIPLSLVVLEGANQIELFGQYWQYDWAELFYVTLPPPPTKADILKDSGVPGKGLDKAPGQQKPFNPDSKAGENAGKK